MGWLMSMLLPVSYIIGYDRVISKAFLNRSMVCTNAVYFELTIEQVAWSSNGSGMET
jgi:hypothetical protein